MMMTSDIRMLLKSRADSNDYDGDDDMDDYDNDDDNDDHDDDDN